MSSTNDNRLAAILALIPIGAVAIYLLNRNVSSEIPIGFSIEERKDAWLVKTPNYNSKPIPKEMAKGKLPSESDILKALESPYVDVDFGQKNDDVVARQWRYSKQKYDRDAVCGIITNKLSHCPRCTIPKD